LADVPSSSLPQETRARRIETRALVADLKARKRSLDEVVSALARQDRAVDLSEVIGALAGLPVSHTLKVMLHTDASGIGVLCRALGLSPAAFRDLLQMRVSRLRIFATRLESDVAAYLEMKPESIQRAVRLVMV